MISLKKTYRFLSALILIALTSSILLPAGIAAANLDCDMEKAEDKSCCSFSAHDFEINQVDEDCTLQTFCEGTVDSNPSDIPAVTQSSKVIVVVAVTEALGFILETNDQPKILQDESASLHLFPPLFLLNSVFLN